MTAPVPLRPDQATPETAAPDPARVVAGDPRFTVWPVEDRGALQAGLWESTPGAWHVVYDEWEYCRILSGHSRLTAEDGTVTDLRPGDAVILRPGFRGVWEVIETTRKDYVILLPGG